MSLVLVECRTGHLIRFEEFCGGRSAGGGTIGSDDGEEDVGGHEGAIDEEGGSWCCCWMWSHHVASDYGGSLVSHSSCF